MLPKIITLSLGVLKFYLLFSSDFSNIEGVCNMNNGLIQVYTGNGKGKTTAAIGLSVRAAGQGMHVKFFQFLKAPLSSGEHILLNHLTDKLEICPLGSGEFIINRLPTVAEIDQAKQGWKMIQEAIFSQKYDIVVIDELSHVLNLKLLDENEIIQTLKTKPQGVEIVLTGSNMPDVILEIASLVTEMVSVKHPYMSGITSRKGIEY